MSQTVVDNSVIIKSLKLSKLDGSKSPIDITPQVVEFSVYEDIKFPVIRAEFIVADANDIASTFPIICEEKIEVEFFIGWMGITPFMGYRTRHCCDALCEND